MPKVLPIKIHISHHLFREHFWLSLLELLASLDLILISTIVNHLHNIPELPVMLKDTVNAWGWKSCVLFCFYIFPIQVSCPQYFPGNIKWIWIFLDGSNLNIWHISLKCVNLINIHIFSRFIDENQHYSCLHFKIIQLLYRSIFDFYNLTFSFQLREMYFLNWQKNDFSLNQYLINLFVYP